MEAKRRKIACLFAFYNNEQIRNIDLIQVARRGHIQNNANEFLRLHFAVRKVYKTNRTRLHNLLGRAHSGK